MPFEIDDDYYPYIREPKQKLKSVDDFNWNDAPEWVKCIAVDSDGEASCYSTTEVTTDDTEWYPHHGQHEVIGNGYDALSWKTSKRLRPVKKVKFERVSVRRYYGTGAYRLAKAINNIQQYLEDKQ